MNKNNKIAFPCRKCRKNISVSRVEVEDSISSNSSFECPFCKAKITKIADTYTKLRL